MDSFERKEGLGADSTFEAIFLFYFVRSFLGGEHIRSSVSVSSGAIRL